MTAPVLRPTFGVRRLLLVLGTVVVGLVFPAASMAATDQIKTTPIHKGSQGFELTLAIAQGVPTGYGGRYPNSVQGILFKHSGNATENDNYSFSGVGGHPLKFKTGKKALQFAQISGTFAHGGGSINMTFHATGKPVPVSVPRGCTSNTGARRGSKRTGTLSGTYTLHADNLGTIKQKSFKATISNVGWTCTPPTNGYDVQTITGEPYVDIFKSATNSVTETIDKEPSGNGWILSYKYYVKGLPSSDYTVGSRLKTASVKGAGGISGTATYNSTGSSSQKTTGNLSGSLAATFASIGKVTAVANPRPASQSHS